MKYGIKLLGPLLLAGALAGTPAQSQEVKQGDIVISQPWSRAAPRGADLASSYMTIENKGTAADRLIAASSEVAEKLEIQQTSMKGGATSAEPVTGGVTISPGDKVVFAPGAYKLALMNLKGQLKKGTKVAMTLEFEKAGKITVPFDVLGATSKGPEAPKTASKPGTDDKMKK